MAPKIYQFKIYLWSSTLYVLIAYTDLKISLFFTKTQNPSRLYLGSKIFKKKKKEREKKG